MYICTIQPKAFQVAREEHIFCKLKKPIYGLKHASRYMYFI